MSKSSEAKKKRILKDITFNHDNAHLALCSKEQGVANNADYALILKSAGATEEFIEKMQQVKVTLELPEFLQRFFGLWCDDAEVLAAMMGYVKPIETQQMEAEEAQKEVQSWIEDRMSAFEIIKSLHESNDPVSAMSNLTQEQILQVLEDQSKVEGYLIDIEKSKEDELNKQEIEKARQEAVDLKKSLEDSKVELQKAKEELEKFKIEKQEAINKARKDSLKEVLADEKVESIFKALESASDESFAEVVSVMKSFKDQVGKSKLFSEIGASTEEDNTIEKSPLEKALHARLNKTSN